MSITVTMLNAKKQEISFSLKNAILKPGTHTFLLSSEALYIGDFVFDKVIVHLGGLDMYQQVKKSRPIVVYPTIPTVKVQVDKSEGK